MGDMDSMCPNRMNSWVNYRQYNKAGHGEPCLRSLSQKQLSHLYPLVCTVVISQLVTDGCLALRGIQKTHP